MSQNRYGLVIPTNSFRIIDVLLARHKLLSDVKVEGTGHARAIAMHTEVKPEIDASYFITSQPTLNFLGKQWLKPIKIIETLDKLQILDLPLKKIDLLLSSAYDGKKHRMAFALINPHKPMFKEMTLKGEMPRAQLLKIHQDFRYELKKILSKSTFRFLKASTMLMVDVNPGKQEMFNRDFVLGLRQPFMQKVVATSALWECTDYEVI